MSVVAVAAPPGARRRGLWSASALACVEVAARHLGSHLPPGALEATAGSRDLTTRGLLAAARRTGLRARAGTATLRGLARLGRGRVAILRFRDGSAMTLVRVEAIEGGSRIILEDARAHRDALLVLDPARLAAVWAGDVVLLRRGPSHPDDDTVPFGFGLIAALVFRDPRIVAELVGAALAISVIALAPIIVLRLLTTRVMAYHSLSTLTVLAAVMLALIGVETALGFCRRAISERLVTRVDVTLWTRVFTKVMGLPIEHFETVPTGLTVYRINLLHKVRTLLLGQMFTLVLDAAVLAVFIPAMLTISVPLTAMVLGLFALVVVWIVLMMPAYRDRSVLAERAESMRGTFLFQTIAGVRTVKSLALDARQRRQWSALTDEAVALRLSAASRANLLGSVVTVLERLLIVGSMAGGTALALRADTPLSLVTLFSFVLLSQRVVAPLQQVAQLVQQFDEARTAVADLGNLVNQPSEEGRSGHGVRTPLVGHVAFAGLRFRYRGAVTPALKDVSFEIAPGMSFGIMGRSGSGKTTITRLLQRLHADYQGSIRLDGVDVRAYDVDHLRASLGVVLQENFLFSGTIRDNIAAAKSDATAEEVIAAARLAGAEEFIDKLPRGYDTVIYEGSPNLSGGQRQRIAIARALITDPKILILDEATSALDAESEAIVNANLKRIAAGRTTIVISHRLASLVACDAILVLDAGEVHDIGRHPDLLERCDIYAGLWARQNQHAAEDRTGVGSAHAAL